MNKNILTFGGIVKRKLQTSYSRKEKLEKLIKNLENLKEKESVSEDRYNLLKQEYNKFLEQSENTIKEIKEDLKRKVEEKERKLKILKEDLENLETRSKVGEIGQKDFQKSKISVIKRIEQLEKEIPKLKELLNSESPSDLGGYLDVKIEEGKGLSGIIKTVGISSVIFDRIKEFFLGLSVSPKKLAVGAGMIIAILYLIVFSGSGLPGKYVNINNESDIVELKTDKTFTSKEYGVSFSGNYKIKGKKLIFELDVFGASFPTECTRVKNGFDCPDGSQYRKVKEKSSVKVKRNSPSATVKTFFEAIEKGEYSKMIDYISSYTLMSEPFSVQDFNKIKKEMNNEGGIKKIDIMEEKIEGETAKVCYSIEYGNGSTDGRCNYLIKEEGVWKLAE